MLSKFQMAGEMLPLNAGFIRDVSSNRESRKKLTTDRSVIVRWKEEEARDFPLLSEKAGDNGAFNRRIHSKRIL